MLLWHKFTLTITISTRNVLSEVKIIDCTILYYNQVDLIYKSNQWLQNRYYIYAYHEDKLYLRQMPDMKNRLSESVHSPRFFCGYLVSIKRRKVESFCFNQPGQRNDEPITNLMALCWPLIPPPPPHPCHEIQVPTRFLNPLRVVNVILSFSTSPSQNRFPSQKRFRDVEDKNYFNSSRFEPD